MAMIVPESILIQISLKIFRGNGMIDTANTTLCKTPKAFDGIYMSRAFCIFPSVVHYFLMGISAFFNEIIAGKFIRIDGIADLSRNLLPDKGNDGSSLNILDHLAQYLPFLPVSHTNYWCFAFCPTSPLTLLFSPYIGLIYFYLAGKNIHFFIHEHSDLFKHPPGRFIGDSEFPFKLFGRYTTTSRSHKENGIKPQPEWGSGFVEDSSCHRGYLVPTKSTGIYWFILYAVMLRNLLTMWAINPLWIPSLKEKIKAYLIGRELLIEVFDGVFCGFHLCTSNYKYNTGLRDVKG